MSAQAVLRAVARELKTHPRLRIELQGHTDSTGPAQLNQRLSQQRADSVRRYMLSAGVQEEQLEAKGYGLSLPVAPSATVEGRAKNRRVVMSVRANPGNLKVEGGADAR